MAYNSFRWVGSGNTGATSMDIFNWNHPGNWEIRKYFGPGLCGGWRYVGTTYCPGPFDRVLIGNPRSSIVGPDDVWVNTQNIALTSKVKSPLLFGGFAGTIAGGTWANSGISGSAGGVTYTSALKSFTVFQNIFDAKLHSTESDGTGPTGAAFRSYNDVLYALQTPLPLGGGITPQDSNRETLEWISRNYPNMGVSVVEVTGGVEYTVPGYTSGSMDNLTLKVYDSAFVTQIGNAGSSPINLNFVGAYSPLSSNNFGATGYTGANAPVVKTEFVGMSSRPVTIRGGLFKTLYTYPHPLVMTDENGLTGLGLPPVTYKNLTADTISISCMNETVVDSDVNFINLGIFDAVGDHGNGTNPYSPWWPYNRTLITRKNDGAYVYGSQYITTANLALYPGLTASTTLDSGLISIGSGYLYDLVSNDKTYGIKPRDGVTGNAPFGNAYRTQLKYTASSAKYLTQQINDGSEEVAFEYLTKYFPEDTARMNDNITPGTHYIQIGTSGVTATQYLQHIEISSPTAISDSSNVMIRFDGNVVVDKITNYDAKLSFWKHRGVVRIPYLDTGIRGCLDLCNPNHEQSQIYFGIASSSGVCGGIETQSFYDSGGIIMLEEGERFFNVATTKNGRVTIASPSEEAFAIAESPTPSVSKKSS